MLKSFAGGRLFGGAWGQGRPSVLALHGWARTHADFAGVFADRPDPAPGAIAPDLPGFGATPPPLEPRGSEWYAEQLLPLFEGDLLADRVVVAGHSFGGRVALYLPRLVPERIERLVLTGVPLLDRAGRRTSPAISYRLARGLHRAGLIGDERMETLRMRYGSSDYRAATGVMRGVLVRVLAEHYDDELSSIGCPVDLVWGAKDHEVPLEVAERARLLLPPRRSRSSRTPGISCRSRHPTPSSARSPESMRPLHPYRQVSRQRPRSRYRSRHRSRHR